MNEEVIEQELEGEIKTKDQLELFYTQGYRNSRVAYLRLILMVFVCFWNFGSPEPTGILSAISGFAIPCFYILSGYFILPADKGKRIEKTKRKIKRSFLCFVFMLVLYILINVIVCVINNLKISVSPRILFNFLVLDLWPYYIGSNIWFIEAMICAYIVIFVAEKLNLMRYYKAVLIITLIFMLLSGEFAGIIHFNILGYPYIPGNWLTRALPYILLGKFLREKEELILKTAAWKYIAIWIVGAGMAIAELYLLGRSGYLVYEGHMLGYGIMAVAACGLVLSKPVGRETPTTAFITHFDPVLSGVIYMLMDPLFYIIGLFLGGGHIGFIYYFGGLTALAVSIMIACMIKNFKPLKAFYS